LIIFTREGSEKHDAANPFFFSDERELKTIIRSNPGLVVLKDGVVVEKWPYRKLTSPDTVNSISPIRNEII